MATTERSPNGVMGIPYSFSAKGAAPVVVIVTRGLEWATDDSRLHYRTEQRPLGYSAEQTLLHYRADN